MDPLKSPENDTSIEALLRGPSSLPDVGVSMRSFSTEDDARQIGNLVLGFLRGFGTYLDLERLEGITVAYDYADAVAQIDRGGFRLVLIPTQDDIAVGVAMAVNVLRDGIPKKHLVFNAVYISFLKNPDDANYALALHILAHEASHVHDLAHQDRAYPGVYGQAIPDSRDAVLFEIAQTCWEEYIASFLSAGYAPSNQTGNFESTLCKVLTGIRERSNAYIRVYRSHADVTRLINELVSEYGNALKYAAYLLGHIEGLEQTLNEAAPSACEVIRELQWFSPHFYKFSEHLKALHATYGNWPGLEVFAPLMNTVHEVLKSAGVEFQARPGGAYYLNVPFTSGTMP